MWLDRCPVLVDHYKAIYAGIRTPIAKDSWNKNTVAREKNGEMRLFKQGYALMIMESNLEPGTTLKTIQTKAMAKDGMSQIVVPTEQVKKACKLALQEFNAI